MAIKAAETYGDTGTSELGSLPLLTRLGQPDNVMIALRESSGGQHLGAAGRKGSGMPVGNELRGAASVSC